MSHRRFCLTLAAIILATIAVLALAAQAPAHTLCANMAGPSKWRTAPDAIHYLPPGGVLHIQRKYTEVDVLTTSGRPLRQCWVHDPYYAPHMVWRASGLAVFEPDNRDLYSSNRKRGVIVALWKS